MSSPRRRALVLYRRHDRQPLRVAIAGNLRSLEHASSPFDVFYYDAQLRVPRWLRVLDFDAVLLHQTFLGMRGSELFPLWKRRTSWLSDLDCLKIALPQDDYDRSEVLDEWLLELGVTDVFSVFDGEKRALLYPLTLARARFHKCLTGYIDDELAARYRQRLVPHERRPRDLVYRAAHLPYRFGSQGQLKHELGSVVRAQALAHGLACDISTRPADAIFGESWLDFLMSGRAVIGCESGASALDRRGEIAAKIDFLLREEPTLSFAEVRARLPAGWDDFEFFTIGPRHLEAVITKTAQILVEGHYDGILEPGRHYLPLKRDFSNLDEVLEQTKDRGLLEQCAERAYEEIYLSGAYNYRRFAAQLENVLERRRGAVPSRRAGRGGVLWQAAERAVALESAVDARTPRSLARLLASPRRSLRKGIAALRLVTSSPSTRRLLLDYLRDGEARRQIPSQNVVADLMRLSLLRSGELGADQGSRRFAVSPLLEDEGRRLRLRSRPEQETADAGARPLAEVRAALREGRVETIVWDHSRIGSELELPGAGGRRVRIGDDYPFQALAVLNRRFPEQTAAAVEAIFGCEA